MTQLIQVMRSTYLITEPRKEIGSTGQTTEKTVAGEKGAEDSNIIDDWEEKDVLLRSWIRHLSRRKHVPDHRLLNCQGDVGMLGRSISSSNKR